MENHSTKTELVPASNPVKRVRRAYSVNQKIRYLELLSINGDHPVSYTARQLGIDAKLLRKWEAEKPKIMAANPDLRKIHAGRPLKFSFESEVVQWIKDRIEHDLPVSNKCVTAYTLQEYPAYFDSYQNCLDWSYRMMNRNDLAIRRKKD